METHQVVVIVGETGSGKTTQVVQYLDEAGWTRGGRVVCCALPRRVAVVGAAVRVAEEMGVTCGRECGYSVRFEDRTTAGTTRVRFVTDGLLVREMLRDPLLTRCSVVMVDEAHERGVQTDVLLGLLRKVLWRNRALRLIVSSATLDVALLQRFFAATTCCVLSVEGRGYPVDICYSAAPVPDYVEAAADVAWRLHCAEPLARGDTLVFLPGQDEIERAARLLRAQAREHGDHTLLVCPLYAALAPAAQQRALARAPPGRRKVVLSTTLAEASVTVPGVANVVDCGFARVRCHDGATGVDALVVAPISQAAAVQRAGRAGRTGPGRCYRLYCEADFAKLPVATVPEIQRVPLAPLVLQLKALGVGSLARFDFLTPPPAEALARALELCTALGALDSEGRLTTPLGTQMALLPLEPQLARAVIAAATTHGCSEELVKIAAVLSVRCVFADPSSSSATSSRAGGTAGEHNAMGQRTRQALADLARRQFAVSEGDHLTYLNVLNAYQRAASAGPAGAADAWCREHGLRADVLRAACGVQRQLRAHCRRAGIALVALSGTDATPVVKSLAAGLFANAAVRQADGSYRALGARCAALAVHPQSVLRDEAPEWVVYSELALTTRPYMRDVTAVTPQLLQAAAPQYFQLRTSAEAAAASSSATVRLAPSTTGCISCSDRLSDDDDDDGDGATAEYE